ncbi:hypothetical protein [Hydrogenophaga sp.]|uniref:hypothetical protein n=1 Tax=Hydrogenophaga sp. TaxID=1904254 RepID=UPI003564000E
MHYTLKLFSADDVGPAARAAAERSFRRALEDSLGDASLVAPVYQAYMQVVARHGEAPDPESLSTGELAVLEQWREAEAAAVTAVFGPMRQMGDADYEIGLIDAPPGL